MWWLASLARAGPELCNGVDDDGDGRVDDGPAAWGPDADRDGAGDVARVVWSVDCGAAVSGAVADLGDCDDAASAVHPGADEACNGLDDDCDGAVDEQGCACDPLSLEGSAWLVCVDDERAWADAESACAASGYHLATIPSAVVQGALEDAVEVYADLWIGCSDLAEEGTFAWVDGTELAFDAFRAGEPNDGADDTGVPTEDCCEYEAPDGTWEDDDCAERQPWLCERECTPRTWRRDADGDGLGDPDAATSACEPGSGWVANDADCDDTDRELPAVRYADADGDGYGVDAQVGCAGAAVGGDCDDAASAVHPGAADPDGDQLDADCDGTDGEGTPPPPPSATDAGGVPATARPEPDYGFGCGCGSSAFAGAWPWWLALVLRRRR